MLASASMAKSHQKSHKKSKQQPQSVQPSLATATYPGQTAHRLSVVDPDPAVRDSIRAFVHLLNIRVETYATGLDFVRSLPWCYPNGVICAAELPDISAAELFRLLHRDKTRLAFAVMLSRHQHQLIQNATAAGITTILHKPLLQVTSLEEFIHRSAHSLNG